MPDLPARKVGLIACSGEELPEGTLSRVAVRLVLERLRPEVTSTLCLPLFLAGENEERAFARVYPTIAVDGCGKWCARRATERYSAPVAGALRVDEALADLGVEAKPAWRRELDEDGWKAAEALAWVIAAQVDEVLGWREPADFERVGEAPARHVACSCGSGLLSLQLAVGGREVELKAVPALFAQCRADGKRDAEAAGDELLQLTQIYNFVPPQARAQYRQALVRAYEAYLRQEGME